MWGITGVQKEAALAATTTIVTVEEVVDELSHQGPNHVVLPSWTLAAIAVVPQGAHPSYAMGYSTRDNAFYTAWDQISRDRETFASWVEEHILGTEDHTDYMESIERG
jgi:glutaconate CoA-transferase subunit A